MHGVLGAENREISDPPESRVGSSAQLGNGRGRCAKLDPLRISLVLYLAARYTGYIVFTRGTFEVHAGYIDWLIQGHVTFYARLFKMISLIL